jgi:hypothetical protein
VIVHQLVFMITTQMHTVLGDGQLMIFVGSCKPGVRAIGIIREERCIPSGNLQREECLYSVPAPDSFPAFFSNNVYL